MKSKRGLEKPKHGQDTPAQLYCPYCDAEVPGENINMQKLMAACVSCNAIFDVSDLLEKVRRKRHPVEMPKRFKVEYPDGGMLISFSHFTPIIFFFILLAVFWNGITLPLFFGVLLTDASPAACIAIPHVTIGLALIYYILTVFLNTTEIRVKQWENEIQVFTGPIPAGGNKRIPVDSIEQIYCEQKFYHNKSGGYYRYHVHALLTDGYQEMLVKNFENPDQAIFIEQQLEHYLNIEDRHVDGEYTGN